MHSRNMYCRTIFFFLRFSTLVVYYFGCTEKYECRLYGGGGELGRQGVERDGTFCMAKMRTEDIQRSNSRHARTSTSTTWPTGWRAYPPHPPPPLFLKYIFVQAVLCGGPCRSVLLLRGFIRLLVGIIVCSSVLLCCC